MFVRGLDGDCFEAVDLRSVSGRIIIGIRPEPVGSLHEM